jgi:hypothetical protein
MPDLRSEVFRHRSRCARCVPSDQERFDEGIANMGRATGAGLLVVVPGWLLVVAGAPLWLTTLYLLVIITVLGTMVLRRRLGSR